MRRTRLIAFGLLGLALALRLALALGMPNDEPDDGLVYSLLAHNLNVHHIYSNDEEEPFGATYVRVPGTPCSWLLSTSSRATTTTPPYESFRR